MRVDFDADAYVMSNNDPAYLYAFSDYTSKGLTVNLNSLTPGANTVGLSGHDYFSTVVPLPAAVWAFLAGLFGMARLSAKHSRRF